MTLNDVLDGIAAGYYDKDLSVISAALDARRTSIGKDSFGIGDRVVFNSQCGTRYLVGHKATVTGMKRTKLIVKLDKPMGRFVRYVDGMAVSPDITVPVGIVDHAA